MRRYEKALNLKEALNPTFIVSTRLSVILLLAFALRIG
jgi:hypothetical protein